MSTCLTIRVEVARSVPPRAERLGVGEHLGGMNETDVHQVRPELSHARPVRLEFLPTLAVKMLYSLPVVPRSHHVEET
jgi:hypothetical protein